MRRLNLVKKLLFGLVAGMILFAAGAGFVHYDPLSAIADNSSSAYLVLSEYYRLPGQSFAAKGHGFSADESVTVGFAGQNHTVTASGSGDFSTTFTVPYSVINSITEVVAHGGLSGSHSAGLSVGNFYPVASPNTYTVLPGGKVDFSGRGFAPNELVIISGGSGVSASTTADSSGNITTPSFTLPFHGGGQLFTFTGQSSHAAARVDITVRDLNPWINLAPYYNAAGATLTVHGHGFGVNEPVVVMFEDVAKGTPTANSSGDFDFSFVVPAGGPGTKTISASGTLTHAGATQQFTQALN